MGTRMGELVSWGMCVRALLQHELKTGPGIPPSTRLRMWRHGFLSESGVLYARGWDEPRNFLNDYDRFVRTIRINGHYSVLLDDKLAFQFLLDQIAPGVTPPLFGLIDSGRMWVPALPGLARPLEALTELLEVGQRAVLRPQRGGGGSGLLVLERADATWRINGQEVSAVDLAHRLSALRNYIVTQWLRQAPYAEKIFPHTANTLRMLTMRDPSNDEVFLAAAVHRFGSARSGRADNFGQGGLACRVNVSTGELGQGASFRSNNRLTWFSRHPDTDARLEGFRLPQWGLVRDTVLDIAQRLSFLPYVGWDVLVTSEGMRVIEGNNRPGSDIMQTEDGLLSNARVRNFYRHHQALGRHFRTGS